MSPHNRPQFYKELEQALRTHPVAALLGPRQCGKTTLARMYRDAHESLVRGTYFDLEDPTDLEALRNPKTTLSPLSGLVIIDEIQRLPDLFPVLRVLVDRSHNSCKFLILGSASRDLIKQSSETLAGRIAYIELTPFMKAEVDDAQRLWIRGGFPNSYLAESEDDSIYWRKQYIQTFLERDIPGLGIRVPPVALRRFWLMLTHYHGQTFNASEIGRSLGVADTTARSYLDILSGTFMIRQLTPWIENLKKRQVKLPKIYFRDSGIYHALSGVNDYASLIHNPKLGASWEGFALEQTIRQCGAASEECYFWGVHGQSELDLLILKDGKRLGFEFKYSDAPTVTKSMTTALEDLRLDCLQIVYPGSKRYRLNDLIEAIPL